MRSRSASVIAAHQDAPGSIAAMKAAPQVAAPQTQTTNSSSDWSDEYREALARRNVAIDAIDHRKLAIDKRAQGLGEGRPAPCPIIQFR